MRVGPPSLVSVLVAAGLAGCFVPDEAPSEEEPLAPTGIDHDGIEALIGTPLVVHHDHRDVTLHRGLYHNLDFVAWTTLDVELGTHGFANFVFYEDDDEDLVFVAIDGDASGGFVIADARDPHGVTPLGAYVQAGSSFQEVRVTPDGRFALLNVQELPGAAQPASAAPGPDCGVCLQLVDVRDRAHPVWVDSLPVDNIGTHNMHVHVQDGRVLVYYVGQPASYTFPTNLPGNYVGIAEVVATGTTAKLVPVGEWRDPAIAQGGGRRFPHDVIVETHPQTGQEIAYVSYWDAGAVTVDVSDPASPTTLDVDTTQDGSGLLSIHWFAPEPSLRAEGRLVAWSAPEIGQLGSDAGKIRAYDVTDPGGIQHLAYWGVPGNVTIPDDYVFSGHTVNVDPATGLVAVSHYHAGVWVLDGTDPAHPRHLAYYVPVGDPHAPYAGPIWWKKPNFDPAGYLPNVYQARWKDDLLWVTERGTGLYVLEYTGPVPGPLG